ncbi:6-phosphofructokinase [Mariniplasma anaerobium]|uniref:ATP-dependent 6-phosphofructokinase n=1 Tax=Mariniplasma anaerobium TaxID=2735436 RepID=A0A7U9TIX9_9MOLU|nr:6-phosphofructokinase [Mariniplasma anaerobium]BCR35504.1 ATP-dependent 6-phosphofructokinase [Mariniplasma anaerobium]
MKIAVLTSGGDAPGMNAAIRAVVRSGTMYGHEVYGVKDGYKGLVEDEMILLTHQSVSGMLSKGGTFLGTSRLPEFKEIEVRQKAIDNLKARDIEALITIGGDGTYRGAMELAKMGLKVIGLPGTIDNDIPGTDFTIGFSTAVQTIVDAIDKLRDTSSSHQRVSIIEVMGRHSGDLAVYAGICGGAEFIITPENPMDKADMVAKIKKYKGEGRRHAIIVITEKILDVHALAEEITEATGFSSRATVLGYIQRGGQPCPEDRILGSRMGTYAVELLNDDIYGVCVGIRDSRMVHLPFANIIGQKRPKNELYSLVKKIS